MNKLIIILTVIIFVGCSEFSIPKHEIGDEVVVNGKIDGKVVDVKNWSGHNSTSDYKVLIDGVAIWYDEEIIEAKNGM